MLKNEPFINYQQFNKGGRVAKSPYKKYNSFDIYHMK